MGTTPVLFYIYYFGVVPIYPMCNIYRWEKKEYVYDMSIIIIQSL
eukprot:COSAG06_NODE_1061_length_10874_cov_7.752390_4_plen_45_part_00